MTAPPDMQRTDGPDRAKTAVPTDRGSNDNPPGPAARNSPRWGSESAANSGSAKNNSTSAFDKVLAPPPMVVNPDEEQRFTLSATQVMASMAAAVTAALVGSRLGVAGTVIGAGLASVISVVGGAIFGHSILLTRKRVKRAVLQVRGVDDEAARDEVAPVAVPIVGMPAGTHLPSRSPQRKTPLAGHPGPERAEPTRPHPTRPHLTRRNVGTGMLIGVAATAAIFVSSLGAVTLIETIKGSPLAGGESGGLSVLGGNGGDSAQVPSDATTVQVTALETVTETVTSEIPATTSAPSTPPTDPTTSADTTDSTAGSPSSSTSAPSTSAPNTSSPTTTSPLESSAQLQSSPAAAP